MISAQAKGAGMSQRHITSHNILSRFPYWLICYLVIVEEQNRRGNGGRPVSVPSPQGRLGYIGGPNDLVGDAVDLFLLVSALIRIEADKMEDTLTRFCAAMPASRNSNEVRRSLCLPTPFVKNRRVGTMFFPSPKTPPANAVCGFLSVLFRPGYPVELSHAVGCMEPMTVKLED